MASRVWARKKNAWRRLTLRRIYGLICWFLSYCVRWLWRKAVAIVHAVYPYEIINHLDGMPARQPPKPYKRQTFGEYAERLFSFYVVAMWFDNWPLVYIPAVGRFLIVCTFIEDALRIVTQWSDQLTYLKDYRKIPWGLTHLFLLGNVIAMCICSTLIIIRKYPEYAVFGLIGVVITQALGYGLIFDLNFFLRNLSVMGGLLLVLSDSWVRKKFAPAGLPLPAEKDRKKYIQLAGRILLILLFLGFIWSGDWGFLRIAVSLIGLVAVVMVVVGFKAKWSATILVIILSIFNLLVNNFWTLHEHHPQKDFAKYDFFQILSIVGGLLLLVNMGPGAYSVDEKKKVY